MCLKIKGALLIMTLLSVLPYWAVASEKTESPTAFLSVRAEPLTNTPTTKRYLPIKITFENFSNKPLRLLRAFKPVPLFFDVKLTTTSHKEIPVIQSSIDPDWQRRLNQGYSLKYLELESNESFSTTIDIGELIPSGLAEGMYFIYLVYRNEYGENCFKGTIPIENIAIQLIDESIEHIEGSISEEKAIELAKAEMKKSINIRPDEKISVRNTAKQFIITFEAPSLRNAPNYKNTTPLRVYINRLTGAIEKIQMVSSG